MTFYGNEILTSGLGQCQHCSSKVIRILCETKPSRTWYTVELSLGEQTYEIHNCRPVATKEAA